MKHTIGIRRVDLDHRRTADHPFRWRDEVHILREDVLQVDRCRSAYWHAQLRAVLVVSDD